MTPGLSLGYPEAPMAKSAHSLLTAPPPGRKPKSQIERWMRDNPRGRAFVDEWIKLRKSGETEWGIRPLIGHLREHFDFPYNSGPSFAEWLRKWRPDSAAEVLG